jgi:ribosomal protein S3
MGQKIHPYGFRVGITQKHYARWFANPDQYAQHVFEDFLLRQSLFKLLPSENLPKKQDDLGNTRVVHIKIERFLRNSIQIKIYAVNPGLLSSKLIKTKNLPFIRQNQKSEANVKTPLKKINRLTQKNKDFNQKEQKMLSSKNFLKKESPDLTSEKNNVLTKYSYFLNQKIQKLQQLKMYNVLYKLETFSKFFQSIESRQKTPNLLSHENASKKKNFSTLTYLLKQRSILTRTFEKEKNSHIMNSCSLLTFWKFENRMRSFKSLFTDITNVLLLNQNKFSDQSNHLIARLIYEYELLQTQKILCQTFLRKIQFELQIELSQTIATQIGEKRFSDNFAMVNNNQSFDQLNSGLLDLYKLSLYWKKKNLENQNQQQKFRQYVFFLIQSKHKTQNEQSKKDLFLLNSNSVIFQKTSFFSNEMFKQSNLQNLIVLLPTKNNQQLKQKSFCFKTLQKQNRKSVLLNSLVHIVVKWYKQKQKKLTILLKSVLLYHIDFIASTQKNLPLETFNHFQTGATIQQFLNPTLIKVRFHKLFKFLSKAKNLNIQQKKNYVALKLISSLAFFCLQLYKKSKAHYADSQNTFNSFKPAFFKKLYHTCLIYVDLLNSNQTNLKTTKNSESSKTNTIEKVFNGIVDDSKIQTNLLSLKHPSFLNLFYKSVVYGQTFKTFIVQVCLNLNKLQQQIQNLQTFFFRNIQSRFHSIEFLKHSYEKSNLTQFLYDLFEKQLNQLEVNNDPSIFLKQFSYFSFLAYQFKKSIALTCHSESEAFFQLKNNWTDYSIEFKCFTETNKLYKCILNPIEWNLEQPEQKVSKIVDFLSNNVVLYEQNSLKKEQLFWKQLTNKSFSVVSKNDLPIFVLFLKYEKTLINLNYWKKLWYYKNQKKKLTNLLSNNLPSKNLSLNWKNQMKDLLVLNQLIYLKNQLISQRTNIELRWWLIFFGSNSIQMSALIQDHPLHSIQTTQPLQKNPFFYIQTKTGIKDNKKNLVYLQIGNLLKNWVLKHSDASQLDLTENKASKRFEKFNANLEVFFYYIQTHENQKKINLQLIQFLKFINFSFKTENKQFSTNQLFFVKQKMLKNNFSLNSIFHTIGQTENIISKDLQTNKPFTQIQALMQKIQKIESYLQKVLVFLENQNVKGKLKKSLVFLNQQMVKNYLLFNILKNERFILQNWDFLMQQVIMSQFSSLQLVKFSSTQLQMKKKSEQNLYMQMNLPKLSNTLFLKTALQGLFEKNYQQNFIVFKSNDRKLNTSLSQFALSKNYYIQKKESFLQFKQNNLPLLSERQKAKQNSSSLSSSVLLKKLETIFNQQIKKLSSFSLKTEKKNKLNKEDILLQNNTFDQSLNANFKNVIQGLQKIDKRKNRKIAKMTKIQKQFKRFLIKMNLRNNQINLANLKPLYKNESILQSFKFMSQQQLFPKITSIQFIQVLLPTQYAVCLANFVVEKLEKRFSFRGTMKKAKEDAMKTPGVKGIKIQISGRLNGAEIARTEWIRAGRVPLQTLRANIDYSYKTAKTIYGILGIKVWVFKEFAKKSKG